jgi:hypothetical protein
MVGPVQAVLDKATRQRGCKRRVGGEGRGGRLAVGLSSAARLLKVHVVVVGVVTVDQGFLVHRMELSGHVIAVRPTTQPPLVALRSVSQCVQVDNKRLGWLKALLRNGDVAVAWVVLRGRAEGVESVGGHLGVG